MSERDDFGPGLRRERERRGVTLQAISEKTKISASLFAAMERNDFSRWPGGIFRRSFLRAYAEAVGLDAELLVTRFLRLFPSPEDEAREPIAAPRPPRDAHRLAMPPAARREPHAQRPVLRLVPPKEPVAAPPRPARPQRRSMARRLFPTAIDLAIIAMLALAARVLLGWMGVWPVVAVAATLVFVISNVFLQATPGAWLVRRRQVAATPGASRNARERGRTVEPQSAPRRHQARRVERQRSRY